MARIGLGHEGEAALKEMTCLHCGRACDGERHREAFRDRGHVARPVVESPVRSDWSEIMESVGAVAGNLGGRGNRTSLRYEHRGGGKGTYR